MAATLTNASALSICSNVVDVRNGAMTKKQDRGQSDFFTGFSVSSVTNRDVQV